MEYALFVTSDAIREAADRLSVALKVMFEGSFKPKSEKHELAYALGTPDHTEPARGLGVVPRKHVFCVDIDTYRSQSRR